MRKLPKEVENYQDECKNETVNKVQIAIDELKAEGCIVTRKLIIERAGVSSSVLSKPHGKAVLEKNEVCQYEVKKKVKGVSEKDYILELSKATKKIDKLNEENKKLRDVIDKKDLEYYKLKEANEILRGQMFLLEKNARIHGIKLD